MDVKPAREKKQTTAKPHRIKRFLKYILLLRLWSFISRGQVKVWVPSYFVIIFIIYSFKCSALTSYSLAAAGHGWERWKEQVGRVGSAETHRGLRRGLARHGLSCWPAGGALMLSVDQPAERLRAGDTGLAVSRSCKRKGRRIAAPKPSAEILLGLFTFGSKYICVSLQLA